MSARLTTVLASLALCLATATSACTARQTPPVAPATPRASRGDAHVYRLDFVLTSKDEVGGGSTTSFTLNVPEHDNGEMMVSRNASLSTSTPSLAPPRQDVGINIKARAHAAGDNVLIDVSTEMSTVETTGVAPPSIRKMVSNGSALAVVGRPALVSTLEDDRRHVQLMVTATRLQ